MKKDASTLIVACGSTVRRDDGVGYHILQQLRQVNISADLVDVGTDIFRLRLHFKQHHQRIIILDALRGGTPGDIRVFTYGEFHEKLEGKIRHAHLLGVIEGIQVMREIDEHLKNAEIYFVGIIASDINKGFDLTPLVKQAVPKAIQKVKDLVI